MIETALTIAIVAVFVIGSIGFVGNGLYYERHGHDQPVLRWMRNLALVIVWPLLLLRAVV